MKKVSEQHSGFKTSCFCYIMIFYNTKENCKIDTVTLFLSSVFSETFITKSSLIILNPTAVKPYQTYYFTYNERIVHHVVVLCVLQHWALLLSVQCIRMLVLYTSCAACRGLFAWRGDWGARRKRKATSVKALSLPPVREVDVCR